MSELYEDTVTYLSPKEENDFLAWVGDMRLAGRIHPEDDFSDYDMRGYWKETGGVGDADYEVHFPDTYKRPNHPTFSVESKYAQGEFKEKYGDKAGHWEGDEFIPPIDVAEAYNKSQNEKDEEYDLLSQKESLERMYGVSIDMPISDTTDIITSDSGIFNGKTIEEVADGKQTSPVNVEAMIEIMEDFSYGCYEFFRSLQEIGAWGGAKVAEVVAGKPIDFDPDKDMQGIMFNQGESPEPKSTAGSIAKVAGQFAPAIATAGLASNMTGIKNIVALGKTAWSKALLSGLVNTMQMMAIDNLALSSNADNLSDVLKKAGLPTIEALVKNPNDTFWEKKIKNSVEGGAAGLVIGTLSSLAKLFWNAMSYPLKVATIQTAAGYGVAKTLEPHFEQAKKDTDKMLNKSEDRR